jgi:hypothetical protein
MALDNGQRSPKKLLAAAFVLGIGLLVVLNVHDRLSGEDRQQGPQNMRTSAEAAVMREFVWVYNCSIGPCSDFYLASNVDCHPTGETLRGTPVYWCSVSYDDNRASTGACVNLAGGNLAMSGPVIQEEHCNASVAKARTNRFFTEADDLLP